MTTPTDGAPFFFMWVGFLSLMLIGILVVFVWAIRTGQFRNQDRARYLPLPDQKRTARNKGTSGKSRP